MNCHHCCCCLFTLVALYLYYYYTQSVISSSFLLLYCRLSSFVVVVFIIIASHSFIIRRPSCRWHWHIGTFGNTSSGVHRHVAKEHPQHDSTESSVGRGPSPSFLIRRRLHAIDLERFKRRLKRFPKNK